MWCELDSGLKCSQAMCSPHSLPSSGNMLQLPHGFTLCKNGRGVPETFPLRLWTPLESHWVMNRVASFGYSACFLWGWCLKHGFVFCRLQELAIQWKRRYLLPVFQYSWSHSHNIHTFFGLPLHVALHWAPSLVHGMERNCIPWSLVESPWWAQMQEERGSLYRGL